MSCQQFQSHICFVLQHSAPSWLLQSGFGEPSLVERRESIPSCISCTSNVLWNDLYPKSRKLSCSVGYILRGGTYPLGRSHRFWHAYSYLSEFIPRCLLIVMTLHFLGVCSDFLNINICRLSVSKIFIG